MNNEIIKECTTLSAEILKNFELNEMPISNIILKCLRLCRLLGDDDGILLFSYESSGYPTISEKLLTPDAWKITKIAGRRFFTTSTDKNGKENRIERANTILITEFEELIHLQEIQLQVASDPNISITSANPHQYITLPQGNALERKILVSTIKENKIKLQKIKVHLYDYIVQIYNKLSYGNIIEDIFTKAKLEVNDKLSSLCPQTIKKFVAVYNNMDSNNPEDWANAVHSCRRILLDLADALYPPRDEPIDKNGRKIMVGPDQYKNRLMQFIENKSESKTYAKIVGYDLSSIGDRLDAIYSAVCKGTHTEISKSEASRYLIHTYLLISDIVSLDE